MPSNAAFNRNRKRARPPGDDTVGDATARRGPWHVSEPTRRHLGGAPMRITYQKPVRDRVPEIMDRAGVRYEVGTLEPGTFRQALLAKVVEEVGELREAVSRGKVVEEITDVFEVLDALMPRRRRASRVTLDQKMSLWLAQSTLSQKAGGRHAQYGQPFLRHRDSDDRFVTRVRHGTVP